MSMDRNVAVLFGICLQTDTPQFWSRRQHLASCWFVKICWQPVQPPSPFLADSYASACTAVKNRFTSRVLTEPVLQTGNSTVKSTNSSMAVQEKVELLLTTSAIL